MSPTLPFNEVVEAADRLAPDEQDELIAILNKRRVEAERERILEDVRIAREEYARGEFKVGSVEEIMREISQ